MTALDAGADDYVVKPFGPGELMARVGVQRRRHPRSASTDDPVMRVGDVSVDLARRRVERAGKALHFTPIEYRLLTHLAAHFDHVIMHHQLIKALWGPTRRDEAGHRMVACG